MEAGGRGSLEDSDSGCDTIRSHFLKFLSALGHVFQVFVCSRYHF